MLMEFKELKGSNVLDIKENGIVEIQITRFGVYDSDNDRVMKGALNRTWNAKNQVHLMDHDFSKYVGLPVSFDNETGVVVSKLNLSKSLAVDLYNDYKFGMEMGRSYQHSHGFTSIRSTKNEKGGRDFHEIKQYEYSSVLFGAVSDTPIHSIKSLSQLNTFVSDFEIYLKKFNGTDETGLYIEKTLEHLKNFQKRYPQFSTIEDGKINDPSNDTRIVELLKELKKSFK